MSTSPSTSDKSLAGTVYSRVNDYRGSIGCKPLERNAGLDRLAQRHSEFMLANRGKFGLAGKNVSHYGFEERAMFAQRAMSMQNVAENVAAGPWSSDKGVNQLVGAWKNSPDHAFNMKGGWTTTGVGVAVDKDGTVFATQIYATKNTSNMTMVDRFRSF